MIFIGDIHGNFNVIERLLNKVDNVNIYQLGDFGVGFMETSEDIERLEELNSKLKYKNCNLYVLRGNHDNPNFFGKSFSNLFLVKDYTIIKDSYTHLNVLMVGGAVSIDRTKRKLNKDYWKEEEFYLDKEFLENCKDIDIVLTHSSPDFCFPIGESPLLDHWAKKDNTLLNDIKKERTGLKEMYTILQRNNNIKKWYYGHFHNTNSFNHSNTEFRLLDIDEIYHPYL